MKQEQYVIFGLQGEAVICVFMGKPDPEFNQMVGRTRAETKDRVYHIAFDPENVSRKAVWEWFRRFANAQED